MKNKQAEKVINKLRKNTETFSIEILGDKENQEYAFEILVLIGQVFTGVKYNRYYGISKGAIELLKEAKIKFKILK